MPKIRHFSNPPSEVIGGWSTKKQIFGPIHLLRTRSMAVFSARALPALGGASAFHLCGLPLLDAEENPAYRCSDNTNGGPHSFRRFELTDKRFNQWICPEDKSYLVPIP